MPAASPRVTARSPQNAERVVTPWNLPVEPPAHAAVRALMRMNGRLVGGEVDGPVDGTSGGDRIDTAGESSEWTRLAATSADHVANPHQPYARYVGNQGVTGRDLGSVRPNDSRAIDAQTVAGHGDCAAPANTDDGPVHLGVHQDEGMSAPDDAAATSAVAATRQQREGNGCSQNVAGLGKFMN